MADELAPLTDLHGCPCAATAFAAAAGDPPQQAEHAPWLYPAQRPGSGSSACTDDCDSDEDLLLFAGLPATGRRTASMSSMPGDAGSAPLTAWANHRVQGDAPLTRVGAVAFSSVGARRVQEAGAGHGVGVYLHNMGDDVLGVDQHRAAPPGQEAGEENSRRGANTRAKRREHAQRQLSLFLDDKTRELEALMAKAQKLHEAKRHGKTSRKKTRETVASAQTRADTGCPSPASTPASSSRSEDARCVSPSKARAGAAVRVGRNGGVINGGVNGVVAKSMAAPMKDSASAVSAATSPPFRYSAASGCL